MKHELNIWVLGGDMRQGKLAQLLSEDGHRVHAYALEEGVVPAGGLTVEGTLQGAGEADCVVLPLPVSQGEGKLNCPLSRLEPTDLTGLQHLMEEKKKLENVMLSRERNHALESDICDSIYYLKGLLEG